MLAMLKIFPNSSIKKKGERIGLGAGSSLRVVQRHSFHGVRVLSADPTGKKRFVSALLDSSGRSVTFFLCAALDRSSGSAISIGRPSRHTQVDLKRAPVR